MPKLCIALAWRGSPADGPGLAGWRALWGELRLEGVGGWSRNFLGLTNCSAQPTAIVGYDDRTWQRDFVVMDNVADLPYVIIYKRARV